MLMPLNDKCFFDIKNCGASESGWQEPQQRKKLREFKRNRKYVESKGITKN